MSATCGNCRHFDATFKWVSGDGFHDGICMGAPPTAVVRDWAHLEANLVAIWPPVKRDMYCGVWSPAVPQPDPAPPPEDGD